jgi:hypothetical protein
MSKPARYLCRFVVVAALALEVAACATLESSTDGQTALVYFFILVYAGLALLAIWLVDVVVRRLRRPSH